MFSEGYYKLNVEEDVIRQTTYSNAEFAVYGEMIDEVFANWKSYADSKLKNLKAGVSAKELIIELAQAILKEFESLSLINKYDVYQVLLAYWNEVLSDDVSMIISDEAGYGVARETENIVENGQYGAKVKETADGAPKTVYFMDVETPTNNDFAIAEEVTVVGRQEKRPDLVIYVNGIAMAVIELKKSSVSVSNGIRQNLTNQKDGFIAPFFTTMQFCMAGNEIEGLRYGTIQTKEKYYMEWKPDGFHENEDERDPEDARIMAYCEKLDNLLLQQIYQMFDKKRFIDLIENFVVYDKGIKKVCR